MDRATGLQPATVPALGHLYKVAGGLKQKEPSASYRATIQGKKKQKPAPISFQTRREKRDPTLWRMRAFSNDKAHSWQILPPSERRGDTDPEKEKEKVGGVGEGEREVRTE